LPDTAPGDFFLFQGVKSEQAGFSLLKDRFKMSWAGVMQTIAKDKFATAFLQWYESCN
jgi:hypothetical protein